MISAKDSIKIFSCNSNLKLAEGICKALNLEIGKSQVSKFSDGEINVKIDETIRGADVYIIQSTSNPVNDHLMELLIMIDAMRRASAGRITAVIPYFGYARQDRKARARDPISAKLVANLLTVAGADRVLTMDLHCAQIQGFFDIPVDHLLGLPILAKHYNEKYADKKDLICVAPDLGSVARTRKLAEKLNVPIAIIDKRRPDANVSEVVSLIGNVSGKRVILVDDMIDTAGTLTNAAEFLVKEGAISVEACCTHGVLSGPAYERLKASPIGEVVALDTLLINKNTGYKFEVLSVANIFAEAITRIHDGESVSKLFD